MLQRTSNASLTSVFNTGSAVNRRLSLSGNP
jgi:hypothetical protein